MLVKSETNGSIFDNNVCVYVNICGARTSIRAIISTKHRTPLISRPEQQFSPSTITYPLLWFVGLCVCWLPFICLVSCPSITSKHYKEIPNTACVWSSSRFSGSFLPYEFISSSRSLVPCASATPVTDSSPERLIIFTYQRVAFPYSEGGLPNVSDRIQFFSCIL